MARLVVRERVDAPRTVSATLVVVLREVDGGAALRIITMVIIFVSVVVAVVVVVVAVVVVIVAVVRESIDKSGRIIRSWLFERVGDGRANCRCLLRGDELGAVVVAA